MVPAAPPFSSARSTPGNSPRASGGVSSRPSRSTNTLDQLPSVTKPSSSTQTISAVPAAARLGLVEVGPRVVFAEVQFADFARLQFRDVEHGLLVALLALHGILLPDLLES